MEQWAAQCMFLCNLRRYILNQEGVGYQHDDNTPPLECRLTTRVFEKVCCQYVGVLLSAKFITISLVVLGYHGRPASTYAQRL